MLDLSRNAIPGRLRLVLQVDAYSCGIACAAMIASTSFQEAWGRLSPPPTNSVTAKTYLNRETTFLNEKGWWSSAQLLLKTVIGLDQLNSIIDSEDNFRHAVENSQRLRLILAFADGTKPDHSVIWDKGQKDVIFDPALGVVPISDIFVDNGLQTYSGTLGFTAFVYQPGVPIQTLIKTENGFFADAP